MASHVSAGNRMIRSGGGKLLLPCLEAPHVSGCHGGLGVGQGRTKVRRAQAHIQLAVLLELHDLGGAAVLHQPPHRHQRRVAAENLYVCARVSLRQARELLKVHVGLAGDAPQVDRKLRRAASGVGQRDVQPLLQAAAHCVVQVPWAVGGRQHHDITTRLRGGAHAVHLAEQLRLEAPRRLVLARAAARRHQRVHLVEEDDGGRAVPRHRKQLPHQLLRLTAPLGGERGDGAVEEGHAVHGRHRLGQQRLARPGRPKQEHALPGLADAGEVLGDEQRQRHGLIERALGDLQRGDVVKGDAGAALQHVALDGLHQRGVTPPVGFPRTPFTTAAALSASCLPLRQPTRHRESPMDMTSSCRAVRRLSHPVA
mmetsp:Transcript_38451/g.98332  ORF Transcript_38451/g.98332 Transcript_38451/m.98332 type:complete len:369 (+) Transcript_38451:336-1442(+)